MGLDGMRLKVNLEPRLEVILEPTFGPKLDSIRDSKLEPVRDAESNLGPELMVSRRESVDDSLDDSMSMLEL